MPIHRGPSAYHHRRGRAIAEGDRLTVLDASNRQHKIRLDGLGAPESSPDFGSRVKQNLSDLVFGKTVTVISSKKDR